VLAPVEGPNSPRRQAVVLQEAAVDVVSGLTPDDRIVDPGRAVDQIQRCVEPFVGEPDLV
jgi:hypothetical protein